MKKQQSVIKPVLFAITIFSAFFLLLPVVQAATLETYGFAWSENIGWISFNSKNCDTDGNGKTDNRPGCLPAGRDMAPYAVSVEEGSGSISGYAWSENIGWITFNASEPGSCPNGTCTARLNWSSNQASGWARACSVFASGCSGAYESERGSWDGWIHLRNNPTYAVNLDTSATPNEFNGFAWSENIGWISFNSKNCDATPRPAGCPDAPVAGYRVTIGPGTSSPNTPPEVLPGSMSAADLSDCDKSVAFELKWEFSDIDSGDSQSAYWLQVSTNKNFPKAKLLIDTCCNPPINPDEFCNPKNDPAGTCLGGPSGTSETYTIQGVTLENSTTYYWRVKVKDSSGDAATEWSEWSNRWGDKWFTTRSHDFPKPNFHWLPSIPSIDDFVNFYDDSVAYYYDNDCSGCIISWDWQFADGVIDESSQSSDQNPQEVKFNSINTHDVTLTVEDGDGHKCSITKSVKITAPLPKWKEIPPFTGIGKYLASASSAVTEKLSELVKSFKEITRI